MGFCVIEKMISIICKQCEKEFFDYLSNHRKFCSNKCRTNYRIGKSSWNRGIKQNKTKYPLMGYQKGHKDFRTIKGKKKSLLCLLKYNSLHSEEKHYNWKGDKVGYLALHDWVRKRLGKPTECKHCGKDGFIGKKIDWANKHHTYKRNLTDWIRLCKSCHKKYDNRFNQ